MSALFGLGLLLIALFGAPLFAVIAAGAIAGFYREDIDLSVVAIEIYRLADMPILVAIPLFTLAGYILGESRAPQRLVRLSNVMLGWMPGGLAIVALVACAIFTAFTGASGATIVALGALLYPAMKQAGYPEKFNLGLITSAGSLGLLFAPSLPLILYAVVAQQMTLDTPVNIDDLFLAGLLPGLLMLGMLSLWAGWKHRHVWRRDSVSWSWKEARAAVIDAAWEIPLPFAVLGGIYGGYIAVSEAAVLTVFYVIVIEVFIHREIPLKRLPRLIREAMIMVGGILIILGVSLASTNYMVDAEIPAKVFETVRAHIDSKLVFLILLNIFLLLLGMMLDIFSAIMIMIPLLLPIAAGYGVHPVHLGIIFLANMQIGYFTPPVGMNLFIASYRFNKPILELCIATLPFFLILLLAVLIITYWPGLSLMLPGLQ